MDESFDEQIPKLQARNRELAEHLKPLQRKFNADASRDAYYFHLIEDNERMEREIAALERPGTTPGDEDDEQG